MDSTGVGQLLKISKHGHIWLFKNLHIKQRDGSKLPKFCLGWILTELVLFSLIIISYMSIVLQVIEKNSEKQNQFLNILSELLLPKLVFFQITVSTKLSSRPRYNLVGLIIKPITQLATDGCGHSVHDNTCSMLINSMNSYKATR